MGNQAHGQELIRFGVFEVDLRSGELRRKGLKVRLQEQPYQVLRMLLERPGEVVTREELRSRLWPADTFVDFDTGLNSAIRKLRDALGDDADNPRFIETLPRRGYRFIAPVDENADTSADSPQAAGYGWKVTSAAIVTATLAIVLGLNVGGLRDRWLGKQTLRSVAVLPLENLSGDSSQEYFADGMTDALITDLAQIGALRVISRTSVMQYKKARKPLPEIAKELNVDAIVEGTVMRSGDRIRIDVQLIRAATDQHLWAHSYEGDLRDVLGVQGSMAQAIASQVRATLTTGERERLTTPRPVNPEAYIAYLRGTYSWNQFTPEGIEKGIQYFQEATQKDPDYAPAYSGLAICHFFLAFLGKNPPEKEMPQAEAAALKALQLDPDLAEAHGALARIRFRYYWDWAGSEGETRRALEIDPNNAEAHREYAVFLCTTGRLNEAISQARLSLNLDPVSLLTNGGLGHAFQTAGQYESAIRQYKRTIQLYPNAPWAHFYLGWAYDDENDFPQAIAELEKGVALSGDNPIYQAALGHAYAVSGRPSDAHRILGKLEARSRQQYVSPFDLAWVYVGLGDKPHALAWLEKGVELRAFELPLIYTAVAFKPLRNEPRFQALLARIGLPPRNQLSLSALGRTGVR